MSLQRIATVLGLSVALAFGGSSALADEETNRREFHPSCVEACQAKGADQSPCKTKCDCVWQKMRGSSLVDTTQSPPPPVTPAVKTAMEQWSKECVAAP